MVVQRIPVCAVDERDDAARGFGGASVVLTLKFSSDKTEYMVWGCGCTLPGEWLITGWCGGHGHGLPTCQKRRT